MNKEEAEDEMYQEITIQLTTHCTLQCPYCFAPKDEIHYISEENFKIFEEFCRKSRPDCIHITGGEPTIHPFFAEMVSRLSHQSALVIYSNLTVPDSLKKIHTENPEEIVFLANLNERNQYSSSQWNTFEQNIKKIKEKGMRLAIGHTFYKEPFEEMIDYVVSYILKNQADHFRISQAMKSRLEFPGLDRQQISKLYHIVASHINEWEHLGIKTYFDCPVPPCYIEKDTLTQLRNKEAVGITCLAKAFVMWDLSVTHCYSTIGFGKKRYLQEFQTIQEIKTFSGKLLENSKQHFKEEKCMGCAFGGQICGCPDYHKEMR